MSVLKRSFFGGFLAVFMAILFLFYAYQNTVKLTWTKKKVTAIINGDTASKMSLREGGKVLYTFDLPTSDMMDASGHRALNFRYLPQKEWNAFAQATSHADIYLDGHAMREAKLERHARAVAITFPQKKLYVLAPPHSAMFAKAVQYERINKQDIFFCTGSPSFCESTKIIDFGGMTALKEGVLEEDVFVDSYRLPRGRWATYMVQLNISSRQAKSVVITYDMVLPFDSQDAIVTEPKEARLFIKTPKKPKTLNDMGFSTQPFVMKVKTPLHAGENMITVMLAKMTEKSLQIPYSLTGVMTRIEITGKE